MTWQKCHLCPFKALRIDRSSKPKYPHTVRYDVGAKTPAADRGFKPVRDQRAPTGEELRCGKLFFWRAFAVRRF